MQISKGEKLTLIIKSLNFQFIYVSALNFQSSRYCIQTNREDLEKLPLEIQQRKSKFSFCALGLSHNSKEQRGARHNKIRTQILLAWLWCFHAKPSALWRQIISAKHKFKMLQ